MERVNPAVAQPYGDAAIHRNSSALPNWTRFVIVSAFFVVSRGALNPEGDSHSVVPRRRERIGPRRSTRDVNQIADLFVTIDKSVAQHAKDVAKAKDVHLWTVVEEALRTALPPLPVERDEQALIEIPQKDRKAS